MVYVAKYISPLGEVIMARDTKGLTTLAFANQKHFIMPKGSIEEPSSLFEQVKLWLDKYFSGQNPKIGFPLNPYGSNFQKDVWTILRTIPYGSTITYGDISKVIARNRGVASMSAQAIGGAVGRNPISIIIPCHRVVGKNGKLTGYAGGLYRKKKLLELERVI